VVETGDFDVLYLLCAPTMFVPSVVAHTDHALRAMTAILHTAHDHRVDSVAVPGLCTGVGCMHPDDAAAQMALAHREWQG
jgi:O-acetyl-ADP-ribose deacetylase (regulator of RNase III)